VITVALSPAQREVVAWAQDAMIQFWTDPSECELAEIAPPRRLAIYLRDGFLCAYCGTDLHAANRRDVTLDHLVAQIHGGSHHERNLVTACHTCNSKRQHKPWRAFCAPGAVERILRNRRRSITRQLVLARAIIRGDVPLIEVPVASSSEGELT
jgi:hypothetical protein